MGDPVRSVASARRYERAGGDNSISSMRVPVRVPVGALCFPGSGSDGCDARIAVLAPAGATCASRSTGGRHAAGICRPGADPGICAAALRSMTAMRGSLPARPSEDATTVRYGQREIRPVVIVNAGLLAVSAAGLTGAALVDSEVAAWILGAVFGPCALSALLAPIAAVAERGRRFVFDATGWWWYGQEGDTLVTWESLAGVCIYSTGDAAVVPRTATLELFPAGLRPRPPRAVALCTGRRPARRWSPEAALPDRRELAG